MRSVTAVAARLAPLWFAVACAPGGERLQPAGISFSRAHGILPVTDRASTGGVSWIDYDGDGELDLFVTNGNDVSASNALTGTWGDFDGDGRLDLYVANGSGSNRPYRNDGRGGFERVPARAPVLDGGSSYMAAWGDVNNDGHLDLVVGNYPVPPVVRARGTGSHG